MRTLVIITAIEQQPECSIFLYRYQLVQSAQFKPKQAETTDMFTLNPKSEISSHESNNKVRINVSRKLWHG